MPARSLIAICLLCCSPFPVFVNGQINHCQVYREAIEQYQETALHEIDIDQFDGQKFISEFRSQLDPFNYLLELDEPTLIRSVEVGIKNDLVSSYCSFQRAFLPEFSEQIGLCIDALESLDSEHPDFFDADSIYMGLGDTIVPLIETREIRCSRYIKARVLHDLLASPEGMCRLENGDDSLNSLLDSLVTLHISNEKQKLKHLVTEPAKMQDEVLKAYFQALIVQYDPYCSLFSEYDFKQFREHLSSLSEGFGIRIDSNEKGDIIIGAVLPGSYAWKTGMINEGDLIIAIGSGNDEGIQVSGKPIGLVLEYLDALSGNELHLSIVKNSREVKHLVLFRQEMQNTANAVQTYVLEGKQKVGYILLPAFYTSWEMERASKGCAQDIGRAIYQLRKLGITSLVIDLRNNGGGALLEAIELAGIFIDFGTFSVALNKSGELFPVKDLNRGVAYSDPLILLVNQHSASASEMLAAVLQDYNRAIIVGQKTYGKAVGQIMHPLNEEESHVLKVTSSKYYRVTGKCYNHIGIIPDIELPALNEDFIPGRSPSLPAPLDSIVRNTFYKPLPEIPVEALKDRSGIRISRHPKFNTFNIVDSLYSGMVPASGYLPLDLRGYSELIIKRKQVGDVNESGLEQCSDAFSVGLLPEDKKMGTLYPYYKELFEKSRNAILIDPEIEECIEILNDYINLQQK